MRLLIDISGLAYRSAYKLKLSDSEGNNTGLVFGVLRSLEYLADNIEPDEMIVCWDRGHEARSKLYPEYKTNRKRDEEFKADFDRQMGVLREVLEALPVTNIEEPGVEADDCIAALSEFMQPEHVAIVTGDQDLYQLASGPAHVVDQPDWNGGRHIILDYDGVPARLEFKPANYVAYKVLVGDSSDNIKGVLGLGDKKARVLLKEHGSLKAIMAWAHEEPDDKRLGRMTYREALPIVKRNIKLIRLSGTPLLTKEQRTRIIAGYRSARLDRRTSEEKFRAHLTALGFKSILRRFSRFLLNFRKLERLPRTVEANHAEDVHPPHSQGGPSPARERARSRGDRVAEGQAAATHYIRRVRKVINPRPQANRRWRRIRRVVGFNSGPQGTRRSRGDEDDGEGGRASPFDRRDDERPQLDPRDGHAGVERALPSVVQQARASRDRARRQRVSDLSEVSQSEPIRRDRALSVLSSLKHDFDWLRRRSDNDLKRVVRIIRWFERDKGYSPSEEDAVFLEELANARGMEMPEWMQTDEEAAEESRPVASLDYWDFASQAIANMGRRR